MKTKIGATIQRQKEIATIAKFNAILIPTVVASSVVPNIAVGGKWEYALSWIRTQTVTLAEKTQLVFKSFRLTYYTLFECYVA